VRTDTALKSPDRTARKFALRGIAWSLGLFALVRLGWVEAHAVLPLTHLQTRLAQGVFGAPARPIDVSLACSGADAIALCAGSILAFPARWRARIGGAGGGIALILVANTLRIGTLGRAAASPFWFQALHVYIWPAVLTIAIVWYVFAWMTGHVGRGFFRPTCESAAYKAPVSLSRRFALLTVALLLLFIAASPLYLESHAVLALAAFIAQAAAGSLRGIGLPATASANILYTPRGAFLVTQECISTPLIPVYFGAVFSYLDHWRPRALAVLAAFPLFVGLGIARLLVVALPAALVGSPLFLIHAFSQLLLAGVLVCGAAFWRQATRMTALRQALMGTAAGVVFVYFAGPSYTRELTSVTSAIAGATPHGDSQGAIAFLPSFQVGLYLALIVAAFGALRWRPLAAGLGLLALSQVALFAVLQFVGDHAGLIPHVRDVRAWAVAGPLVVLMVVMTYDQQRG
jgi:exosortase/archaeosortase family protein